MAYKFDNAVINDEKGRNFIIKVVDFFVNRAIEETESNRTINTTSKNDLEKRYYNNYKFIRDSINTSKPLKKDIYYVLIRKAAIYIDFIEDGVKPNSLFPLYILDIFELTSWFKNNIDRYRTHEIIVVLINKLFSSIYRDLFI